MAQFVVSKSEGANITTELLTKTYWRILSKILAIFQMFNRTLGDDHSLIIL